MQATETALFARARRTLERIDEKSADLNQLRWTAACELHQLAEKADLDTIATQLGRKRADVVSYITTWAAYGDDEALRQEQTYSGLQRLVRRYPDDPEARRAIIDQARAEGISVATVMDHHGYRGGGRRGGSSHDPDSSFIRAMMNAGAPLQLQEAAHGLDTVIHHLRQLRDQQAVLTMEQVEAFGARLAAAQADWAAIVGTAELAAMAQGADR